MLSFDSRSILRDLLLEVAVHERQIEVLRQILTELPEFEPYAAFRRLDRLRRGFVTATEICEFVLKNEIHHTEEECELFVIRYDQNNDGKLQYSEFLNSLLPMDNPELRLLATQRKVYDVGYDEFLSYEVEHALARLFSREIEYQTETGYYKIELANQRDFSLFDAFASVDIYATGYIDYTNLRAFFKSQGQNVNDENIIAIIRRIDRDGDGKISCEEFILSVQPQGPGLNSEFKPRFAGTKNGKPSNGRAASARSLKNAGSTSKSATKLINTTQQSNLKTTKKLFKSTKKLLINTRSKSTKRLLNREKDMNEQLILYFKEFIKLEQEIEVTKQELALRTDYNLFDAFRIFDSKGRGLISVSDIEQGCQELAIYPNKEDIYLLIKRFDRDGDGKLRFTDFADGFAPIQIEYYNQMKYRVPINGNKSIPLSNVFTTQTRKLLKNLFVHHIENEVVAEALRQKLNRGAAFNIKDAFAFLDRDYDGYITIYELQDAFDEYRAYVSEKDLYSLISRFDKNDDKKISFAEFVAELSPKSKRIV